MSALHLAPLPAAQDALALDLLDRAFADDPTLAWCLYAERPPYPRRRRAYLASYQRFHRASGLPTLAAWQGGQLLGLSYFSLGDEAPSAADLAELGQAIRQQCGADCLARLDRLVDAFERHLHPLACARLEFLAVAPEQQGRGIGGALLAQTLDRCQRHGCRGIALETGAARNLALYRRHGLQQRGDLHLPGLRQHYLGLDWCG